MVPSGPPESGQAPYGACTTGEGRSLSQSKKRKIGDDFVDLQESVEQTTSHAPNLQMMVPAWETSNEGERPPQSKKRKTSDGYVDAQDIAQQTAFHSPNPQIMANGLWLSNEDKVALSVWGLPNEDEGPSQSTKHKTNDSYGYMQESVQQTAFDDPIQQLLFPGPGHVVTCPGFSTVSIQSNQPREIFGASCKLTLSDSPAYPTVDMYEVPDHMCLP